MGEPANTNTTYWVINEVEILVYIWSRAQFYSGECLAIHLRCFSKALCVGDWCVLAYERVIVKLTHPKAIPSSQHKGQTSSEVCQHGAVRQKNHSGALLH